MPHNREKPGSPRWPIVGREPGGVKTFFRFEEPGWNRGGRNHKELADLATSRRQAEVIQWKDRAGKDPLPSFKDRQLELAVQHLREQSRRPGQAND